MRRLVLLAAIAACTAAPAPELDAGAPPSIFATCGYAPAYTDPAPAFTTIGTDMTPVVILRTDDWAALVEWTTHMRTWRDCIEGRS